MPLGLGFPVISWFSERSNVDIEKLGRYDIIGVLGKGAMGVVYEGRDPNLDRRVAIKTIRVQNLSAEAAVEYEGRFRTEARSAARLHHPNIVSVFDSGQDGNIAYLVMEFVQGEDLKHHLECGERFSVRASIVMVHELLMALDHAHRQNVVHRDIKPANLLIEVSGRIKLTDFGVARIQDPDETNLTQVGGAVGTPKYMSPEQAKGQRGDSRSDVFSAGVVLYELLVGHLPFDGDNQFVVIHQIVNHEAAPPSSLRPEVPLAMDEVMARALAKDPEQRYATAREFALALRGVASQVVVQPGATEADVATELGRFQNSGSGAMATDAALRDGSSTGIFGSAEDVSLVSTINHDDELSGWNKVKDSVDVLALRGFLARFPSGIYARRAQQQLEKLMVGPQPDPDATVSHFQPLLSGAAVQATAPASAPPIVDKPAAVATPGATKQPSGAGVTVPSKSGGAKWAFIFGGLALAVGIAVVFISPKSSTESAGPVESAPGVPMAAPSASGPASTQGFTGLAGAAAVPSAPGSVPASARPTPAASARPASAPVKPAIVASQAVPSKLVPRPTTPEASPVTKPADTVRSPPTAAAPESAGGPTSPGNICADRVFVFRIACVSKACTTERFRGSQECVEFREMERAREEQRNNQR
jgi:serine/threonine-protein kinase